MRRPTGICWIGVAAFAAVALMGTPRAAQADAGFVNAPYTFSATSPTVLLESDTTGFSGVTIRWRVNTFDQLGDGEQVLIGLSDVGLTSTTDSVEIDLLFLRPIPPPLGGFYGVFSDTTTVSYINTLPDVSAFGVTQASDGSGMFSLSFTDPDFAMGDDFDTADFELRLAGGATIASLTGVDEEGSHQLSFAAGEFDALGPPGTYTVELWAKDLASDYFDTGLTTTLAIPEPTSALALLGPSALLALRRRTS